MRFTDRYPQSNSGGTQFSIKNINNCISTIIIIKRKAVKNLIKKKGSDNEDQNFTRPFINHEFKML